MADDDDDDVDQVSSSCCGKACWSRFSLYIIFACLYLVYSKFAIYLGTFASINTLSIGSIGIAVISFFFWIPRSKATTQGSFLDGLEAEDDDEPEDENNNISSWSLHRRCLCQPVILFASIAQKILRTFVSRVASLFEIDSESWMAETTGKSYSDIATHVEQGLKKLHALYDKDNDSKLDRKEFEELHRQLGDSNAASVDAAFAKLDSNNDGKISIKEFACSLSNENFAKVKKFLPLINIDEDAARTFLQEKGDVDSNADAIDDALALVFDTAKHKRDISVKEFIEFVDGVDMGLVWSCKRCDNKAAVFCMDCPSGEQLLCKRCNALQHDSLTNGRTHSFEAICPEQERHLLPHLVNLLLLPLVLFLIFRRVGIPAGYHRGEDICPIVDQLRAQIFFMDPGLSLMLKPYFVGICSWEDGYNRLWLDAWFRSIATNTDTAILFGYTALRAIGFHTFVIRMVLLPINSILQAVLVSLTGRATSILGAVFCSPRRILESFPLIGWLLTSVWDSVHYSLRMFVDTVSDREDVLPRTFLRSRPSESLGDFLSYHFSRQRRRLQTFIDLAYKQLDAYLWYLLLIPLTIRSLRLCCLYFGMGWTEFVSVVLIPSYVCSLFVVPSLKRYLSVVVTFSVAPIVAAFFISTDSFWDRWAADVATSQARKDEMSSRLEHLAFRCAVWLSSTLTRSLPSFASLSWALFRSIVSFLRSFASTYSYVFYLYAALGLGLPAGFLGFMYKKFDSYFRGVYSDDEDLQRKRHNIAKSITVQQLQDAFLEAVPLKVVAATVVTVSQAGRADVNGRYQQIGKHSDRPKFKQIDGNAILYFENNWKINGKDDTKGWYYQAKPEHKEEDSPPNDVWTTNGYGKADAGTPPTVESSEDQYCPEAELDLCERELRQIWLEIKEFSEKPAAKDEAAMVICSTPGCALKAMNGEVGGMCCRMCGSSGGLLRNQACDDSLASKGPKIYEGEDFEKFTELRRRALQALRPASASVQEFSCELMWPPARQRKI